MLNNQTINDTGHNNCSSNARERCLVACIFRSRSEAVQLALYQHVVLAPHLVMPRE